MEQPDGIFVISDPQIGKCTQFKDIKGVSCVFFRNGDQAFCLFGTLFIAQTLQLQILKRPRGSDHIMTEQVELIQLIVLLEAIERLFTIILLQFGIIFI